MSVSDDCSIRLWSIQDETCMRVLYGHTARVWDARYCDTGIVSVGEDSVCLVWNLDGQVVKKYSGHKGKVAKSYKKILMVKFLVLHNSLILGFFSHKHYFEIWNFSYIIKNFLSTGKSIWSLDVSKNNIVTGGGDGGIRRWDTLEELVIRNGNLLLLKLGD